jgi:hypothetical protein
MYDILRWVEAHPGLAAWVQAVGSVFAVTAAASLPFIHGYLTEKRETKVRLAALFALAQQSVILLEDLAEAMKTESGMRDYMHLGVTGEWTESGNARVFPTLGRCAAGPGDPDRPSAARCHRRSFDCRNDSSRRHRRPEF